MKLHHSDHNISLAKNTKFLPTKTIAKSMYTKITLGNMNLQWDKEPMNQKCKENHGMIYNLHVASFPGPQKYDREWG